MKPFIAVIEQERIKRVRKNIVLIIFESRNNVDSNVVETIVKRLGTHFSEQQIRNTEQASLFFKINENVTMIQLLKGQFLEM